MARTLHDDEERARRIELVGSYVLETGSSTRKAAEYFSANFFPISNYTVSEYCKLFLARHKDLKHKYENIIDQNKPETINNEEIKKRVLLVATLVEEGFLLEEISKRLDISFWIIYRDIHNRLEQIDSERYNKIQQLFETRSLSNLNNSGKQK